MAITFEALDVIFPKIKKRETALWIKSVAASYGKQTGDISYIFCNDENILRINQQYLQHDFYTDIITFDYSENELISGDIFISLDTVLSNSVQYQTDSVEELYRVIIHGILHLCGLNDKSETEYKLMKEAEEKALKMR